MIVRSKLARLHQPDDLAGRPDVVDEIASQEHQVRLLSGLDRAHLVQNAQRRGPVARGDGEHVE